jgi:hypothetical protein
MSHENLIVDKLSHRLPSLLPEFVREESPALEQFLKAYFEFLEAEILVLESPEEIGDIVLEDGQGSILLEPYTVAPSPDAYISKIVQEKTKQLNGGSVQVTPFQIGEYVYGSVSGSVAEVKVVNGQTLYLKTISGNGYSKGETVTGRDGNFTAKVKSFKENTILANNRLLDYSDIDHTTESFLEYFQKDFVPSLNINNVLNKRLAIKNISTLYKKKGTEESLKFLMRILYGEDAEIRYPFDQTIQISESNHSQKRRMVVRMDNENLIPSATDKIVQYTQGSDFIEAESIVENVYNLETDKGIYSIEITDNHIGTFTEGSIVNLVDRDGVTNVTARVLGVINDVNFDKSSIYFVTDEGDNIVLETVVQSVTAGAVLADKQKVGISTLSANYIGTFDRGDIVQFDNHSTQYRIIEIIESATLVLERLSSPHGTGLETDVPDGTIIRRVSEGLISENNDRGSLYEINNRLDFVGGNRDKDAVTAKTIVDAVNSGGIEKIYIEDGGNGYYNTYSAVTEGTVDQMITEDGFEIQYEDNSYCVTEYSESSTHLMFSTELDSSIRVGQEVFGTNIQRVKVVSIAEDRLSMIVSKPLALTDNSILQIGLPQLVVFDNRETGGSNAHAVIGSVGDEIILENKDVYGQFEFTATAGQTLFNGRDNYGNRLIFNDQKVRVFVDGIEYQEADVTYGYAKKNDRITFNSGLSVGQQVDIYQEFNNLVYEDGTRANLETTNSAIRTINIIDEGVGYRKIPKVYPGGYVYVEDATGYQIGEQVNQSESGVTTATGLLIRIEKKEGRLVVARRSTDTGTFLAGKQIVGGTSETTQTMEQVNVSSGTGAKLFAWSSTIGGVGSVNVEEQGYNFSEDGLIAPSSHHPMLIKTPTTNLTTGIELTGAVSGTTATVLSYDADRHILVYTDLNGDFLDEETVNFNLTDSFVVLKNNRFDGRGNFGGEGLIEEQLLGDKSTLDASAANIHDGLFYQTHSYVVKIGESINKWRSAVKDLLHPAGHIFFGEVAIKNVVVSDETAGIISADDSLQNVNIETRDDVDNSLNVEVIFRPTIIIHGDTGEGQLLYEDGSRILINDTDHIEDIPDERLDYLLLDRDTTNIPDAFYNSSREIELHDFFPHGDIVFEDGGKPLLEEQTTGWRLGDTNYFRMEDTSPDPLVVLLNAGLEDNTPAVDTSVSYPLTTTAAVTDVNGDVTTGTVLGVDSITNPAGVDLPSQGEASEFYDTSHKNRHFNVTVINSFAHTPTQYSPRLDDAMTVLNLCRADDNDEYLTPINSFALVPERRPSDQGKIFSVFTQEDEILVLEDGGRIEMEEHVHYLRFEPNEHAIVKDCNGDRMLLEDGDIATLESATEPVEFEYFVSERSIDLFDNEIYTEDYHRIIMEDGSVLVHEQSSENNISTFVPLGHTFRTLNTIQGQRTYNIAYYLKDETDSDDFILEDGTGAFLKEESKSEGIRISDFSYYYPDTVIPDYPLHERKRTNIAFSTYVKSA